MATKDIKSTKSSGLALLLARLFSKRKLSSLDVGGWADSCEVSDEIMRRFILAHSAQRLWRETRRKRVREMPLLPGETFMDQVAKYLLEEPDNEITREYREAAAALDATPDPPPIHDPVTGLWTDRYVRIKARRAGTSEEVVRRYERADIAYRRYKHSWKASQGASLPATEQSKSYVDDLVDNLKGPLDPIRQFMPENEITREYDEALAVLRAADEAAALTRPENDISQKLEELQAAILAVMDDSTSTSEQ